MSTELIKALGTISAAVDDTLLLMLHAFQLCISMGLTMIDCVIHDEKITCKVIQRRQLPGQKRAHNSGQLWPHAGLTMLESRANQEGQGS